MESLRGAPIEGAQPYLYYLYLDATFLDARWARKVENVSALVAYAVGPDSHHRLLGITLGPEESQDSWSELLKQLLERVLSGVELVIADEHPNSPRRPPLQSASAQIHPKGIRGVFSEAEITEILQFGESLVAWESSEWGSERRAIG